MPTTAYPPTNLTTLFGGIQGNVLSGALVHSWMEKKVFKMAQKRPKSKYKYYDGDDNLSMQRIIPIFHNYFYDD